MFNTHTNHNQSQASVVSKWRNSFLICNSFRNQIQNGLNKVFMAVYSRVYLTKVKNDEILVNGIVVLRMKHSKLHKH